MVGEDLGLCFYRQDAVWRMVGGATGKFLVAQSMVLNQDLALAQPLAGLLPTVVTLVAQRVGSKRKYQPFGVIWRLRQQTPCQRPWPSWLRQMTNGNGRRPMPLPRLRSTSTARKFGDEQGSRAAFRQAIIAVVISWSRVPNADFALTYAGESQATHTSYNGVNEVLFMHKKARRSAWSRRGSLVYSRGQDCRSRHWINDDYRWNATGAPGEVDLQSALLHEFGHWLIWSIARIVMRRCLPS